MTLRVSIITTCKGRLKHLKRTLPLLLNQKCDADYEVIVVDYDCPDKTYDWVKTNYNNKCIRVKDAGEYFNFARALNIGMSFSHADVLVKIDCDQLVEPDWLQTMLNGLGERPIINALIRGDAVKIGNSDTYNFPSTSGPEGSVSFGVTRDAWLAVNGLDESFEGWGYEDCDFVDRVLRHYEIALKYVPYKGAFINHGLEDSVRFYAEKDKATSAARNLAILQSTRDINPNGYGVTLDYELFNFSVDKSWGDVNKKNIADPYGYEITYKKAAKFLGNLSVEDWGGGKGWAKRYIEKCVCIDGSSGFADKVVNLEKYISSSEGILIRHVLEHNWNWKQIVKNALASFTGRLCIIFFIPPGPGEKTLVGWREPGINVPNLIIPKDIFEELLVDYEYTKEVVDHGERNLPEVIYYINNNNN